MRIVFMGTPDFAVASLDALLLAGENIVAVVTAPDKPAGRGQKLQSSAVKLYALSRDIPVLQPVKLKDPEFLTQLTSYQADLQVVVAFRMLPEIVWNMPPKGTICTDPFCLNTEVLLLLTMQSSTEKLKVVLVLFF